VGRVPEAEQDSHIRTILKQPPARILAPAESDCLTPLGALQTTPFRVKLTAAMEAGVAALHATVSVLYFARAVSYLGPQSRLAYCSFANQFIILVPRFVTRSTAKSMCSGQYLTVLRAIPLDISRVATSRTFFTLLSNVIGRLHQTKRLFFACGISALKRPASGVTAAEKRRR
jgi:hypothetical protein